MRDGGVHALSDTKMWRKNTEARARAAPLWWRVAIVLVFASGLALRIWTAWSALEKRPFSGLPDDSYYYFAIAKHLAQGNPPSIDGINPTNGFHPLWMLVLTTLYRLGGWGTGALAPLHVAFTIGAVLDVASAYLLFRLMSSFRVHRQLKLLISAIFLLNPYEIELATWGLETPLSLFVSLLFVFVACRAPRGTRSASPWIFGATGALMMLSRTDHVIVFVVAWLLRARRIERPARARFLAYSALVAAALSLPWPIYSFVTTGTVIQNSSLAMAIVHERLPAAWGFDHQSLALLAERLLGSFLDGVRLIARFSGLGGGVVAALGAACATICITLPDARRRALLTRLKLLLPWTGGLVALFFLHCFVRKVFREWYTAPFIAALLVTVAICLDAVKPAPERARRLGFSAAVATTFVSLVLAWRLEGVFELNDFTTWSGGAGRREGQTDCGAAAYFLDARITNLDGVVNASALSFLREGRLLDYIERGQFERVSITPQLHSKVFLGPGYRERLLGIPGDPYGSRLVTAADKDAVIVLGDAPVVLGSVNGRELLSDGWDWPMTPTGLVPSVGASSELIFVGAENLVENRTLAIELASVPEAGSRQHVAVFLNDTPLARLDVDSTLKWFTMGAKSLVRGRNRLRLEYGEARPVRVRSNANWWSGWNWIFGYPVRAVRAGSVRLDQREVALPPEGPALIETGSNAHFRAGFLAVERLPQSASIWAVKKTAEIAFSSALEPAGRKLVLWMGPPPPSGDDGGQHVELTLNNQALPDFDLPAGTVSRREILLPEGLLLRHGNRLIFAFTARRRRTPRKSRGPPTSRASRSNETPPESFGALAQQQAVLLDVVRQQCGQTPMSLLRKMAVVAKARSRHRAPVLILNRRRIDEGQSELFGRCLRVMKHESIFARIRLRKTR